MEKKLVKQKIIISILFIVILLLLCLSEQIFWQIFWSFLGYFSIVAALPIFLILVIILSFYLNYFLQKIKVSSKRKKKLYLISKLTIVYFVLVFSLFKIKLISMLLGPSTSQAMISEFTIVTLLILAIIVVMTIFKFILEENENKKHEIIKINYKKFKLISIIIGIISFSLITFFNYKDIITTVAVDLLKNPSICNLQVKKANQQKCYSQIYSKSLGDYKYKIEITEEFCEKLTDYNRKRCLNDLYIDTRNWKSCKENLERPNKCLSMIALLKKDPEVCLEIETLDSRNRCIKDVNVKNRDLESCYDLEDEENKELCISGIAVVRKNVELCNELKERKNYCIFRVAKYMKSITICENIKQEKHPSTFKGCMYDVLQYKTLDEKTTPEWKNQCNEMSDENQKNICLEVFDCKVINKPSSGRYDCFY